MEENLNLNPKKSIWPKIFIVLAVILVAVIIALVVSKVCFATFIVDGISMYPTLDGGNGENQDSITTNGEKLILNKVANIKRNDIIVFTQNWDILPASKQGKPLVKRVIAIGGDKIKIYDNKVLLNDTILEEPYLPQGVSMSNMAEVAVPEGSFFCMGDNRNNSTDCRYSGTCVPKDNVLGKCILIKGLDGKLRKV